MPIKSLSFVIDPSPLKMRSSGFFLADFGNWPSVSVCDFFAGTVVLRLMSVVITPPAVSRPSESGVTSSSSRSESFSDESAPDRMAACTVAPKATASSGLMLLHGSLPLK